MRRFFFLLTVGGGADLVGGAQREEHLPVGVPALLAHELEELPPVGIWGWGGGWLVGWWLYTYGTPTCVFKFLGWG